MDNLFDTITKGIKLKAAPKAPQKVAPLVATPVPTDLKTTVMEWQKYDTSEARKTILKELEPTMRAAITSYAPGMERAMRIPAAKLVLESMRLYKPDMGTDPKTYAFHSLKRLSRVSATRSNIMPNPEGLRLESQQLADIGERIEDETGREASMAELSAKSGLSLKRITRIQDGDKVINDSSSLDEMGMDSTMASKDVTDKDYLDYVYASVDPINQKIMEWSTGMYKKPVLSNQDIAAKLKMSPAAVSQRRAKIEQMLSEVRGLL